MKFTTNASNLATALALVMRSINTRISLVGARGVLMEAEGNRLTITGTDLDTVTRISLVAVVKQSGRLLLGADKLSGAFLRPSASDAEFVLKGGEVSLKIGRSHYNLRKMDVDDFPPLPSLPDVVLMMLPAAFIHHAADQVSFAAAKPEDNKPAMIGTAFRFKHHHMQVVATNGGLLLSELQLPYDDGDRPQPGTEIVLPPASLDRMQRLFNEGERVSVARHEGWAGFFVEGREFYTKMQAEVFPPAIDMLLETQAANRASWMEVERDVLLDGVRRMDVVASRDPIHPLRLRAYGSRLEMYSSTEDGDAVEVVDVDRDGPDFMGLYRANDLATLLGKVPGDRVRIDFPETNMSPLILKPASMPEGSAPYTLMQAPINPEAPQAASTLSGPRLVDPEVEREIAALDAGGA